MVPQETAGDTAGAFLMPEKAESQRWGIWGLSASVLRPNCGAAGHRLCQDFSEETACARPWRGKKPGWRKQSGKWQRREQVEMSVEAGLTAPRKEWNGAQRDGDFRDLQRGPNAI